VATRKDAMSFHILQADARHIPLADESVQCVVTSPPYWALRDYGTATWQGGDETCNHRHPGEQRQLPHGDGRQNDPYAETRVMAKPGVGAVYRSLCGRCGARRIDNQLGLEATPEAYVANMVAVFREVRRILRPDGVLFLNLGPSYSNAAPNLTNCLDRILEGCVVFGFDAIAITSPAQRVHVAADHQRSPDGIFFSLFGVKWECIKQRDDNLGEIIDCLAIPRNGRTGIANLSGFVGGCSTATDVFDDMANGGIVVLPDLNAHLKPKLTVLRSTSAWTSHGDDTPFAVEKSGEPRTESLIAWHSTWDSFALAASSKCVRDVDIVNQSVALRNGALPLVCLFRDFKVAQASEKKLTLVSISGGLRITVSNVGHLVFSLSDGSLVPYRTIYSQAIRMANRNCAKQEIDTPGMVKTALQEDGWICRQTIIWSKPNQLPESVRDRCTKAHEYIFLLTKNPQYFYNADAIAEPAAYLFDDRGSRTDSRRGTECNRMSGTTGETRNKRSVWTVATQPFSGAHFATFPPDLIKPMILAGSRPGDIVLDPFSGAGTTCLVADRLGRRGIGLELNPV